MQISSSMEHPAHKITGLLLPEHTLSRSDMIWMLAYIQKKVEEQSAQPSARTPAKMLSLFQIFANISKLMITPALIRSDPTQIKQWIEEAHQI